MDVSQAAPAAVRHDDLVAGMLQVAKHVIPARAYENQLYVAYANHSGDDDGLSYVGLSSICGPDGAVLASDPQTPHISRRSVARL